jgi:hypothetical protein
MKIKAIQRHITKCLLFLLGAVFCCTGAAHAVIIDDTDCPSHLWDLTGTYIDAAIMGCHFSIGLIQDAKGKITTSGDENGDVNVSCAVRDFELGWVYIFFSYDVKGRIKQSNGIATAKIRIKLFNGKVEDISDNKIYLLKGSLTLNAQIDPATPYITGDSTVKACLKGLGCKRSSKDLIDPMPLPVGMDGAWTLDIDEGDTGIGTLTLSNGGTYTMSSKSKTNTKKGTVTYNLKGLKGCYDSTGCSVKAVLDEATGALISLKAKLLGQKLRYP